MVHEPLSYYNWRVMQLSSFCVNVAFDLSGVYGIMVRSIAYSRAS